jgi:hypothetical protein
MLDLAIRGALLLAVAAPTFAVLAAEAPAAPRKTRYVEGQLLTLIAPTYPEAALREGETSTIEITGKIQPDGRLAEANLYSEPLSIVLEEAVRKVLPAWRFQPRVESPSCQFRETPGRATIWFEIVNAKPKVSYSVIKPEKSFVLASLFVDRIPTRAVEPRPPSWAAGNRGIPDEVLQVAYVGILRDGSVHSVSVSPRPYAPHYEPNLRAALMQWKFEPASQPGCMEIEAAFQRE